MSDDKLPTNWREVKNWTPELRAELMRELKPKAEEMLSDPQIRYQMDCMLSLCEIINDGEYFEISRSALARFWLLSAVIMELGHEVAG